VQGKSKKKNEKGPHTVKLGGRGIENTAVTIMLGLKKSRYLGGNGIGGTDARKYL